MSLRRELHKTGKQYLPRYLRGFRLVGREGRYGAPPDFIVVGMQKAGTNAVRHALNLHPRIQIIQDEIHYFDKKYWLPRWWYENHFLKSPEIVSGDTTPLYMGKKDAIDRIHAWYPDVKLVALIREPIQRAFSKWNRFRLRHDPSRGEMDAFAQQMEQNHRNLLSNGFYAEHIRYIWDRFPRERVHIAIAERMGEDPAREWNAMARFLGLPPHEFGETPRKHATRYTSRLQEADVKRLYTHYAKRNEELYELLGERIPEWDEFYRNHGLL